MSNRRKATPAELEFITAAREGDRDRLSEHVHHAPQLSVCAPRPPVKRCAHSRVGQTMR
jgi:hypothetical protein